MSGSYTERDAHYREGQEDGIAIGEECGEKIAQAAKVSVRLVQEWLEGESCV